MSSTPKKPKIYLDDSYRGITPLKIKDLPAGLRPRGTQVPEGEFLIGSPCDEGNNDEHPQHKVYLDGYYIDKYEVSNEQYARFLNEYGKNKDDNGNRMIYRDKWGIKRVHGRWQPAKGYKKHPVVRVSWYGANQYAKFYGKRLPTEAEWEKACRAGSNTKYCFGDRELKLREYAWYRKNSGGKTHPVGTKKPNKWGIYDMHGNVWEWCSDWYDREYYKSSPTNNPRGAKSDRYRVLRGGSWCKRGDGCRSAGRGGNPPDTRNSNIGFRCVGSGAR